MLRTSAIVWAFLLLCFASCSENIPRDGTRLVYEVDHSKTKKDQPVNMKLLVQVVTRRLNPDGKKKVVVRASGPEQIEIFLPKINDEAERKEIESTICRSGTLEFRVLASPHRHEAIIKEALAEKDAPAVKDAHGKDIARWVPVMQGREPEFLHRSLFITRTRHKTLEVLVVLDPFNVTGDYLIRAMADIEQQNGEPCVTFSLYDKGGSLFGALTGAYQPELAQNVKYQLGIIFDGEIYSAPTLQAVISDHVQITGNFTEKETKTLANVLNAGELPVPLRKVTTH